MNLLISAAQSESKYQNALLSAVYRRSDTIVGTLKPHEAGLSTYRNNGSLNASRALSLMFPTVYDLLGEDDFYPMARLFWLAQPPLYGDWSQYGGYFADWIAYENPGKILDALPFLPDLARLDDALSRCQDAPDATPDLSTLALLEQNPECLQLLLHPSVSLIACRYNVTEYREQLLAPAQTQGALPEHPLVLDKPMHAMVVRKHWRSTVTPLNDETAAFVRLCLAGATIEQAYQGAQAVNEGFDFSEWLSQAIAAQCLVRVQQNTPLKMHP